MSKVKILKAAATAYLVFGIIVMMFTDDNILYGTLAIVCFVGSFGFYDQAENIKYAKDRDLLDHLDNNGTGND